MSKNKKAFIMISLFALMSAISFLSSCGYLNPLLGWKEDLSPKKPTQCPDTIGVIPENK